MSVIVGKDRSKVCIQGDYEGDWRYLIGCTYKLHTTLQICLSLSADSGAF